MRDQKVYQTFSYGHKIMTINTMTPFGGHHTQEPLISPSESANSGRRDSGWNEVMIDPSTALALEFRNMKYEDVKYPTPTPSSGGVGYHDNYTADTSNSPECSSCMSSQYIDQKPHHDPSTSFYSDSPPSLPTTHVWNTSQLMHPTSSGGLNDSMFSNPFMPMAEMTGYQQLPSFIAPSQSVRDPSQSLAMSFASDDWNGYPEPVHNANILPSSSPRDSIDLPPTPETFEEGSIYCHSEPSPGPVRSSRSRPTRTRTTARQRRRNQARRYEGVTTSGVVVEISDERLYEDEGVDVSQYARHECQTCRAKFRRSEHCKRHEKTHDEDAYAYGCYVMGCRAGRHGNGSQNRPDNSRSHAWTHVKAWLNANDALVSALNRSNNNNGRPRNRPRNRPCSPAAMRDLIRVRDGEETMTKVMKFVNLEAGKEFGVHFDFDDQDYLTRPCPGQGRCNDCKGRKKNDATRVTRHSL